MNRYWVFCGEIYYPPMGMVGFVGSFESLYEALIHLEDIDTDWGHIIDSHNGEIVFAYEDANLITEGISTRDLIQQSMGKFESKSWDDGRISWTR